VGERVAAVPSPPTYLGADPQSAYR